jgi:hypothetical protein
VAAYQAAPADLGQLAPSGAGRGGRLGKGAETTIEVVVLP